MPRFLTPREAARIRIFVQQGRSYREVAALFGIHNKTVMRVVQRFQETRSDIRRRGQGRPRATSEADDRFVRLNALRNRTSTSYRAASNVKNKLEMSKLQSRTIRRRLHEGTLSSRRPARGPLLTRRHRVMRLPFAQNHVNWTVEDWKALH
ncbi:uncharacterized protein LOC124370889 [Homalodisca vitripennis]|uniref:uncharacterized protein LOC124370889 n=1 Tax=Homalodisca vitripennis TaxID=197043 RepID=UPI001EE9DFC1|nr:uncharacterized protein LOC124370889 [Homalodisca vitripennis]